MILSMKSSLDSLKVEELSNEHCLFTLDYITNMTFESSRHKSLYFAFIDFKKAYDSIDRRRLIEVLIKFKINPQIIDLIVQMYEGDSTIIQLG